ncbi:hypothetical protein CEXT_498681 [Caerostris extrusa]|uniref:Uncharacterized protein n=1 Tax=Caerostris extrusa TaxID=172846 RepID=A0AAV4TID6_CAEEX|nr:hypothetical protein CEXT_498681 [Caerostris extrusa]
MTLKSELAVCGRLQPTDMDWPPAGKGGRRRPPLPFKTTSDLHGEGEDATLDRRQRDDSSPFRHGLASRANLSIARV